MEIYDTNAPLLMAQGYFSLPIEPNTKRPGRWSPGLSKFIGIPNWQNNVKPVSSPQPGAGIAVRLGGGLVCVDFDHDEHALILCEVFGETLQTSSAHPSARRRRQRVGADVYRACVARGRLPDRHG